MACAYREVMSRFIHEELGLAHTWLDMPREVPKGYSVALPVGVDQKEKNHWIWNHKIGMAAGGIYSTLEDMTAYVRTYLSNTPKYLELALNNGVCMLSGVRLGPETGKAATPP